MDSRPRLPSYAELFGNLDFKKGDEARSVYSPAAYLADLLQLLDDHFAAPNQNGQSTTDLTHAFVDASFADRRPDIPHLDLNAENTFAELPYLDIVIEVLERAISEHLDERLEAPYEHLKKAVYPFQLPFDLEYEKIKKYLHYHEVSAEQMYKQYAPRPNFDTVARVSLGLSAAEYSAFIAPLSAESEIKALFGLDDAQSWTELAQVGVFLKMTNLTGAMLRELLFQSLSELAAEPAAHTTERSQAAFFFINNQLGGYATLSEDEERLAWSDGSDAIPLAWFERVSRFVRLANKTGLALSDLDLILRSCCNNQLDSQAIRTISVIKQLHDAYDVPIDVVCSFFSPISTLGIGDATTPQDLFNRIFNVKFVDIDKKYILGTPFIPATYATRKYSQIECTGDLLSLNNKEYRWRLCKALDVSDHDLAVIVTQFRAKYPASQLAPSEQTKSLLSADARIELPALSLLHRVVKMAELLDISYPDFFGLLDLLERDPSIRKDNNFEMLIPGDVEPTLDCYHILEYGEIRERLWLGQMLMALAKWMQANDFTSQELNLILSGRATGTAESSRNQKIAVLDNLYQQFKAVMLTADAFVSSRFNTRAAQVIHRVLTEQGGNLTSRQDRRLVRFDAAMAGAVAYHALDQLAVISKEDFLGLGLEQRLVDKMYANLIIKGYLSAEGEIAEPRLPKRAADFELSSDFHRYAEPIFMLIHNLITDDTLAPSANGGAFADQLADNGQNDAGLGDIEIGGADLSSNDQSDVAASDVAASDIALSDVAVNDAILATSDGDMPEVSLYPSDLEGLAELSEAQRAELYDNLVYNGYIDAEGNVLQVDFFAAPENSADLQVNADLSEVAADVLACITRQIAEFDATPLALDTSVFAGLGLSGTEIADLVENLQFNQYIDQASMLLDKRALLALTVEQFQVALAFYPKRRQILAAIKDQIDAYKVERYTVAQEAFSPIADAAVAQRVIDRLGTDYLRGNRIPEQQKAFFLDRENLTDFVLGADISASDHALIFGQIATILADQQKYQLQLSALEELDFDANEIAELFETLRSMGDLTEALLLPHDKLDYFLNVKNALEFSIPAFVDFNKDIFFILHALAKECAAAIDEIVVKVKAQADSQAQIVFAVLQEALDADAGLITIACQYILSRLDHAVEEFMLPILTVVNSDDRVSAEPASSRFNLIYKRLAQFALLATKLRLSPGEAEIALRDQNLVEKFPEKLMLPDGVDRFDALLEDPAGVIYVFRNAEYWAYSAQHYNSIETADHSLTALSERFDGITKIDAAFTDRSGICYIVAGEALFSKQPGSTRWVKQTPSWGQVKSNFADPARIDTAFRDREGKTYLFAGTQYIRYSGAAYATVDEGYPLAIAGNWEKEGLNTQLPAPFKASIDASFQGTDERTYLFKDNQFISSDDLSNAVDIRATWGKVRNNFLGLARLDAAYADGADLYFFAGDQVIAYSDSIENEGVCAREGYPQRIEAHFKNLPAEFESDLEAAFLGLDSSIHLFKDGKTIAWRPDSALLQAVPIRDRWGVVSNRIQDTGRVDAAFVGLDGRTYLFSDDQYVRYSGANYTQVDEGYPRLIADTWGGLRNVNAAFVLDGKTYLFEKPDGNGQFHYVRYSTNDYHTCDAGYPKPMAPDDNWWNLPAALVEQGAAFERVDAVFCGRDNRTYLFAGDQFIAFDNKHRWWSEPQPLKTKWDSIPFAGVDAAFVGNDGKTYLFYGTQYIRYSNSSYSKVDDRYPNDIRTYWGSVVNNIAKTGRVDAALVIDGTYTYLFSGNQYVRYSASAYTADGTPMFVDSGYPKYIATSLKTEPRFQNLPAGFQGGVDAAFADRRNIYLFQGSQCQVISASIDAVYELSVANPGCAFLEHGGLLIEEAGTWQRYSAIEGTATIKTQLRSTLPPATLRGVPDQFKSGLNAVLQGIDGNTYLFKGPDCFNRELGRAYPLAEEWGRAKNNIYLNNSVDAAFVGRDGKTYLFSGDQFFVYSGQGNPGAEIDGEPKSIKDHWAGLTSVGLAYVKDEKTYLFERPDGAGNFRYVCYSTSDYSQPDATPRNTTIDFWNIPDASRTAGFSTINAVLIEGDKMFLIGHDLFIEYDQTNDRWSYPRPLSRIWRDIPLDSLTLPRASPTATNGTAYYAEELTFPTVKAAFTGADGTTYFFSEATYVSYRNQSFTAPAPIRDAWGLTHNNFVHNRYGNQVDAAFVFQGKFTYLFSGDQYVRYSGQDYRSVDAGYPKPLLGNLRQEPGFQNLPATFEDVLLDRISSLNTVANNPAGPADQADTQARRVINAVVANDRNVHLLIGTMCYVVAQSLTASYELSIIGRVKNNLVDQNHVDASFVGNPVDGHAPTYLFAGDQYVRYSGDDYTYVDDGYPRSIADSFTSDIGFSEPLPDTYNLGLDAVLCGADGSIYLFKDKRFRTYLYDGTSGRYTEAGDTPDVPIADMWGKVNNNFTANLDDTTIDAAFLAPNGYLYAFKGDQFIRYQAVGQEFVDEGYPKAIKDNWGNLPVEFEAAIDGAFVFDGKTYLLKDDRYVRYSDSSYQAIDSIYPQAFRYRWGAWADYLLSDVKTIARFKQLQDTYANADGDLAAFLSPPPDAVKMPYDMLAAIFDWDSDELEWLKRHNGFLGGSQLFEEQFQLELIIKLVDIFGVAQKIGAGPSDLYATVWQKLYQSDEPALAAEALYRYLGRKQSEPDWQVLARQIHHELNLIKRDVLMPVLIAQRNGIENARDLYERYLIDVEMGSSGITSRIQEAIAATQLLFHRYFVNLEDLQARPASSDETTRRELKGWWQWMKNYRVWEANRKVFLYPENYIRPELRNTKTPAFKTLEEDLLQGDITAPAVERAYKKYLDEYTEVSRLTIAGGYVFQASGMSSSDRRLVLFGRTKTDPRRYYYRMADFLIDQNEQTSIVWTPWLKVDVQIDADNVYPVFAFDRVFVFWAKAASVARTGSSTALATTTSGDDKAATSKSSDSKTATSTREDSRSISANNTPNYAINIYYSFYNLNMEWVQAQTLTADMPIPVNGIVNDINAFNANLTLAVENSDKLNIEGQKFDHENIVVNCTYTLLGEEHSAFYLTPELYARPAEKHNFTNPGQKLFQRIVDEPEVANAMSLQAPSGPAQISPVDVVMFNKLEKSSDGPWFSFDYKGGSFLCRPAEPPLRADVWPHALAGNSDGLPEWPRIDAAFATPDGTSYFFDNASLSYAIDRLGALQPTKARWGHVRNNIAEFGVVDAGLMLGGKLYLFSGDQYLTFSDGLELADEDCPKTLSDNAEGLPRWQEVKAAFTGLDQKSYFFNNQGDTKLFVALTNGQLSRPRAVTDQWGKMRPANVAAAFTLGSNTFLAYGKQLVRYTGSAYAALDAGYPQAFTTPDQLAELKASQASSIDPQALTNIFYAGTALYFQAKGADQLQRFDITAGKSTDEDFRKHLSEDQLVAAAIKGSRIYAFKRKGDGKASYGTLSIYNLTPNDDNKKNTAQLTLSDDDDKKKNPASKDGDDKKKDPAQKDDKASAPKGTWEYRNISIVDGRGNKVAIDQALVGKDGLCYLFAGEQYMKSADWAIEKPGSGDPIIRWKPEARTIVQDWLKIFNRIAETGLVDAAVVINNYTYLFSGDQYVRYTGGAYDYIDDWYPKPNAGNAESLPPWDLLGAAVRIDEQQIYYFDNRDQTYVRAGKLGDKLATKPRWGIIKNNFTVSGLVDTAYVRGNTLFLISGDEFIRYTLAGSTPGEFVDATYPKSIVFPAATARLDAALLLGAYLYIFAGEHYFKLPDGQEPDTLPTPELIEGNWGSLPAELHHDLNAALQRGDTLFVFQGNQYARYPSGVAPYEIIEASYDIIRLTTSTAYKLNQRLFAGGVAALLNLDTQETDELPSFSTTDSTPTTIRVRQSNVGTLPESSHMDFDSTNGIYYWEIFFHAPFLIAQALNAGQKFEEAKGWYEYIFDPTEKAGYWRFLPFLGVDMQALIDACTSQIQVLQGLGIQIAFDGQVAATLAQLADVFQQRRQLSPEEEAELAGRFGALKDAIAGFDTALQNLKQPDGPANLQRFNQARASLSELVAIIEQLGVSYRLLGTSAAQIKTYLDDPFDPHAIAALRPTAYRKAIVMAYVDNLIDWGDMLFRQYTRETIEEARMLYILAYDLLGEKPQNLGTKIIDPDTCYDALPNDPDQYELTLYLPGAAVVGGQTLAYMAGTPHASVGNPYFFVPENSQFGDYWERVEDRLYKIRHSLNILGISQPLPLFEPPIDPMALVQAVAAGAPLSSALASLNIPVPHYRFTFMLRKAQDLAQKLAGFGNDLLGALEKKDAEELSLLQNRQEATILTMTRAIKEAQVQAAAESVKELEASLQGANNRADHYQHLIDADMLPAEIVQIVMMSYAANAHMAAAGVRIGAALAHLLPESIIAPPLVDGIAEGGQEAGNSISSIAEMIQSLGEGFSMVGEALGVAATHQRSVQDWELQLSIAQSDVIQIGHQLAGARLQQQIAEHDLEIQLKQIEHNAAIKAFMQSKFSNAQLYQWMAGRLAGLYFQTYSMAYDIAKAAEKALQFERGLKESEASYIQPLYWDTQKKGLLAGESLGLDLDRMEKASIETNSRGFEITKEISLLELDPVAMLQLKSKGACEFAFGEALFDYDFPGHYCRQVKTIALTFVAAENQRLRVNATLTQLGHKTVLEPDAKAVKFLLEPKDQPPASVRSDWRASQQIVLSHVTEGVDNNGLFELRFDDDRYFPFEGTGAVSGWRLELNGKRGAFNMADLLDVTITLKYTAEQGGAAFATAVKGMLKPYPTARFFDVARDFPDAWQAFVDGDSGELALTLSRDMFPNMSSSKITSIFARFELAGPGAASMVLNGDRSLTIKDGKLLPTNGLGIASQGAQWVFALKGDKANVQNIGLVLGYKARVD
jgi:hypothetical protein